MRKSRTSTPEKLASRRFNPVKRKLEFINECFEQLQNGLPATQEAYVDADKITHTFVKSSFLMIIQRALDINNVIIEFNKQPAASKKRQSFLTIHQNAAIDKKTLDFFIKAISYYENIIDPYEEIAPAELYEVSQDLLKYGKAYTDQIENYFANSGSP